MPVFRVRSLGPQFRLAMEISARTRPTLATPPPQTCTPVIECSPRPQHNLPRTVLSCGCSGAPPMAMMVSPVLRMTCGTTTPRVGSGDSSVDRRRHPQLLADSPAHAILRRLGFISPPVASSSGAERVRIVSFHIFTFSLISQLFWLDSAFYALPTDLWAFNTATLTWASLSQGSTRPGGRNNGAAFIDNDDLYLFAGYNGTGGGGGSYLNDLWSYNLVSSTWTSVRYPSDFAEVLTTSSNVFSSSNDPAARWKFTSAQADGSKLFYIMGGVGVGFLNSIWEFSTDLKQWTRVVQFGTTYTTTNVGTANSNTVPATVFGSNGAVYNGRFYTFFGDAGSFSGLDLTYSFEITCPSGFFRNSSTQQCSICSPGSGNAANNVASACGQCSAGQYSNSSTGFVCTNCQDGYGAASPGSSSCSLCPAGTLSNGGTGSCLLFFTVAGSRTSPSSL
jgi:hypothetical protein